jgi:hypothetical protein
MKFENHQELKEAGFTGFKRISELFEDSSSIPKVKGVYMVLTASEKTPKFLAIGTGGHFKGKNPNVSLSELKSNWVNDSFVVYIGKAGKEGSSATLQSRLRQYLGFGKGGNVGHWGGRLIWQLSHSHELEICWLPMPKGDPREFEAELIRVFVSKYGVRPFANLAN